MPRKTEGTLPYPGIGGSVESGVMSASILAYAGQSTELLGEGYLRDKNLTSQSTQILQLKPLLGCQRRPLRHVGTRSRVHSLPPRAPRRGQEEPNGT